MAASLESVSSYKADRQHYIIFIKSADAILSHGPDLSWIYLQYTDDVGHLFGDGPELDQAVCDMDFCLGQLRVAVETR